jgi:hypothetical protein
MKKALIVVLVLSSSVQAQVIMGPDGRNVGYATQYGNYTQYTDKNGNTGYSFTDGTTTTFTGKDGRVTSPDRVVPSGVMPWEVPLVPNLPTQPKRGAPQF